MQPWVRTQTPEYQVEQDWDPNRVSSQLWEAGRFCKPQLMPAPGPCDPGSSLAAVNHLFWFLPTRRLAAAPLAEAVGVGEMQARGLEPLPWPWEPVSHWSPAPLELLLLFAASGDFVWGKSPVSTSARDAAAAPMD